jgi:hypothetical protein
MGFNFILLLLGLNTISICLAGQINPAGYQKIVDFAVQNVNMKASDGFRFFKVQSMSLSEVQNGRQYHMWLLYLRRDGMQDYFNITVYENPWGELTVMDISKTALLANFFPTEKRDFLQKI